MIAADPDSFGRMRDIAETPELTGHVIWALYGDAALMEKSGKTWIGAELARDYGLVDDGGRRPPSYRDLHGIHPLDQFARVLR
jgi:hypothetical protein